VTLPDTALYGALAGVAAITTALQSVVALQPLRESFEIKRRKRASSPGLPPYNDARSDARQRFTILLILNFFATAVNASVLAAWGKVGVAEAEPGDWHLWLPWVAVAVASAGLLVSACVSIVWLARLGWGK
jgi:hypothetical protein